jgi:hypothetical protein
VSRVVSSVLDMEWFVLGAGAVAVVGWLLSRSSEAGAPAQRPARPVTVAGAGAAVGATVSPMAAEIARRAADPDDPDGAFMDGYVPGRYTERWLARDRGDGSHGRSHESDRGRFSADDELDALDENLDGGPGRDNVWADPDDSFHDDFSDDW